MKRLILIVMIAAIAACSKSEDDVYYTFEEQYVIFEGTISKIPFDIEITEHQNYPSYYEKDGLHYRVELEYTYSIDGIFVGDPEQFWIDNKNVDISQVDDITFAYGIIQKIHTGLYFINVWRNEWLTSNIKFIVTYKYIVYSI